MWFSGRAAGDSIILELDVDHTHLHGQINNDAVVMTASDVIKETPQTSQP